jgi:hypothetical protein
MSHIYQSSVTDQDFLISLLAVIETTIRQSPALANIVSQICDTKIAVFVESRGRLVKKSDWAFY